MESVESGSQSRVYFNPNAQNLLAYLLTQQDCTVIFPVEEVTSAGLSRTIQMTFDKKSKQISLYTNGNKTPIVHRLYNAILDGIISC